MSSPLASPALDDISKHIIISKHIVELLQEDGRRPGERIEAHPLRTSE